VREDRVRLDEQTIAIAVDRAAPSSAGGMGCVLSLLVVLAAIVGALWLPDAGAPLGLRDERFGGVVALSLTLLLAMPVMRAARSQTWLREPPREALARALAFALLGPCVGLLANDTLGLILLDVPGRLHSKVLWGAVPALLIVLAPWASLSLGALPFRRDGRGPRPRVGVGVAWGLFVAMALAVACGAIAARRPSRAGWSAYFASLATYAEVPLPWSPETKQLLTPNSEPPPPGFRPWRMDPNDGGFATTRVPGAGGPTFLKIDHGELALSTGGGKLVLLSGGCPIAPGPILIRADLRHELIFVSVGERGGGKGSTLVALRMSDGVPIELRPRDIASALPPPRLWTWLAALGLPIALALLLKKPPIARLGAVRDRWHTLTRDEDGRATLPSGARVDWPAGITSTEIVAIDAAPKEVASYRGPAPPAARIVPCARETLEASIDMAIAARAISAIAVLLLTGAPLLVAIAHGLAP
jgi:hypothetical protein